MDESKMVDYIPVTLMGVNLGERHRYLNSLVAKAHNIYSFQDIENVLEQGPVDRIFKIDVASKVKDVEFILKNLKDDDLLYVSRALKATWLLDGAYRNHINPSYLENTLFPEMVTTAITRMKHWIYINLRDPERCQEFYEYYKETNFNYAIKFLCRCNNQYILEEFPKILIKITPHYLKIYSEKCPKLTKIYFDVLTTDTDVTSKYLKDEVTYFDSIKCVLKCDPDVYLDIIEKYFNRNSTLSPAATKYVMTNHKQRYLAKPELYASWLLHLPTLAKLLSEKECKELVIKLARATYLSSWYSYKAIEPLIKRIRPDCRAAFKKRIFIDKDIGELAEKWPYPTPSSPPYQDTNKHVFDDVEYDSKEFDYSPKRIMKRITKRKGGREYCEIVSEARYDKTELDRLFDEYRFTGFDRTFYELSQRLRAMSSAESRRNIFMVLVSKTAGRHECVAMLLQLLARHINEPANIRTAIVRSLVKRAQVWRIPSDSWTLLLKFAHNLGLDGAETEDKCSEGLHAVVLREFLLGNDLGLRLQDAFLRDFSTLREYSINVNEGKLVVAGLTRTLLTAAAKAEPQTASQHFLDLFNVYQKFKIRIDAESAMIPAVKDLFNRDANAAEDILKQLYEYRIARRELFLENLSFLDNDAAYTNIIRHDGRVLSLERLVSSIISDETYLNQFIKKMSIYFAEKNGLAAQVLNVLKERLKNEPDVKLARPLATLIGQDLKSLIQYLDEDSEDVLRRVAAALRANVHCARPKLNIDESDNINIGAKALTTESIVCRSTDVEKYVNKLLTGRRTVKAALLLAQRSIHEAAAFAVAAKLRHIAVLKSAMAHFRRHGEKSNISIWETIQPILLKVDLASKDRLQHCLLCVEWMPYSIKPEYCVMLYKKLSEISVSKAIHALHRDLESLLPRMDFETVEDILLTMLSKNEEDATSILYPNIFIQYLLLCKSEEEQTRRFEIIGRPFFKRIEKIHENSVMIIPFSAYLNRILKCLKYNKVFFDARYVSCLPLIDKIEAWMHTVLGIEKNFVRFVETRLTVLFFEAVRQSIIKAPKIFSDPKKVKNEGVDIVAKEFGINIARGLMEFTTKYFDSITEMFKETFLDYFDGYFPYGPSKNQFALVVNKAILEANIGKEARLVSYYVKNRAGCTSDYQNFKSLLANKDIETQFFYYADLCTEY